jgi:hypothetical protein
MKKASAFLEGKLRSVQDRARRATEEKGQHVGKLSSPRSLLKEKSSLASLI